MTTLQKERDRIRELAGRIAALAAHPREAEKISAWQTLNDLRPQRPMLWITEIPWGEIQDKVSELTLQCRDEKLRSLETTFLRNLFTARRLPIDRWGSATAQIFGDVSPEMHDEFALRYEMEVLSRCGLNYYGCCEPLHHKMHLMAKIPRLRKISISPWCNVEKAAGNARERYVFSHKPSPAIFAGDRFDADRAEREIRKRLDQSNGMPCEIVMKDISTIRGDAARLIEWCRRAWRIVTA